MQLGAADRAYEPAAHVRHDEAPALFGNKIFKLRQYSEFRNKMFHQPLNRFQDYILCKQTSLFFNTTNQFGLSQLIGMFILEIQEPAVAAKYPALQGVHETDPGHPRVTKSIRDSSYQVLEKNLPLAE